MIMNKKIEKLTYGIDQLHLAVDLLKVYQKECSVFTFTGPLGAGKTTLIRALLNSCGITDTITSPTFTYVNVYKVNAESYYHFDLYRLSNLNDFLEQDFDEYLYQPMSWTFIEWPEIVYPLLDKRVCHVKLDYLDSRRQLTLEVTI